MGSMRLSKVIISQLKRIKVNGGDVLHALKKTDIGFNSFGEAYFSIIDYNQIKCWKRHNKMTMNIVVPIGKVKFVFYYESTKDFDVFEIGENNYFRLTVPPGIWFGFMGLSKGNNLVLNISDILHDTMEFEKAQQDFIKFKW